mmetsp:Transcript_19842/g.64547  ORF Transcript_19842/g.64547 Transcript_19842/m.64547 type:complete len:230 (-) Transcript_19842:1019-1708(-)
MAGASIMSGEMRGVRPSELALLRAESSLPPVRAGLSSSVEPYISGGRSVSSSALISDQVPRARRALRWLVEPSVVRGEAEGDGGDGSCGGAASVPRQKSTIGFERVPRMTEVSDTMRMDPVRIVASMCLCWERALPILKWCSTFGKERYAIAPVTEPRIRPAEKMSICCLNEMRKSSDRNRFEMAVRPNTINARFNTIAQNSSPANVNALTTPVFDHSIGFIMLMPSMM